MAGSHFARNICIIVVSFLSPWCTTCLQPLEGVPTHGWKEDDPLILDDETRDAFEYASKLYETPDTHGEQLEFKNTHLVHRAEESLNSGQQEDHHHEGQIPLEPHQSAAYNLRKAVGKKIVETSSTNETVVVEIAAHCLRHNKLSNEPKLCKSVGYGEKEIKQAKLRPTKCLQEMLPGVKAKICTLCERRNCDKVRKVLEKIENHLVGNAAGVISLLRNAHTAQERLHTKFKVLDDAFESATTPKTKHRLACSKEIREGTFGPGLCRAEIEELMPGQSELVLNIADQNHNKMITSGELRNFFSTALVFTHMAAPVVMHGSSLDTMQKFPFMERLQKWLGWEESEKPPLADSDPSEDI